MAGEASIASAYLSIIPSMAGAQGTIAAEMTAALSGAGSAADKAGSAAGASLGQSLLTKAKSVLAPAAVAAAVAGVGTGLYKIGETFDDVTDTIRTGTGATGDALTGLVDVAKDVGSQVPVSFDKIGPVVADLNTRLGLSGDTLETVASQYLEAGNILAKQLTFMAQADAAGIVLGARAPIILTSRADNVRTRMASCAVAVLIAHTRRGSR